MDTTMLPRPDTSPPARPRALRPLLLLGLLSSLVTAVLGVRWLLDPQASPLETLAVAPPLLPLLGAVPLYTAQVVVALLGAVAGAAALLRPAARWPAAVAALQVALFGMGFASFTSLAAAGYLIALAMPLLLVTIGVMLVVHGGRARWAAGVPMLVLLAVGAVAGAEVLVHLSRMIVPSVLSQGPVLLVIAHFVAAGGIWAVACGLLLRTSGHLARLGAWAVRRRRALTLLAACGPLPYALIRLTWFTPWPLLGGELASADLATRVWGLAISSGAWLGVLLTLGLIRPWGEVFPRWFPGVGGRPVPVAFAAVPGAAVAALLCFAAVPMVLSAPTLGVASALVFALVFPCWFWGPALALAVWGYVGHRRSTIDPRAGAPASARMGA